MRGLPSRQGLKLAAVSDEFWRIAGAAGRILDREVDAGYFFGSLDHFADGEAVTITAVHHVACLLFHEVVERLQVRLREVVYVDVIADAGAVRRCVIGAIDQELIEFTLCGFEGARDEVGGFLIGLTDAGARVGSGHVEVAQGDITKIPVGGGHLGEDPFHHDFGGAIGINGIERGGFDDRHHVRYAVGCCRGRIDDVADVVFSQGAQESKRVGNVVSISI